VLVYSLFGHVATVTQLENMGALKVVLFTATAEHGHFIFVKQAKLFLVSSCVNMLVVQRNEEVFILVLCDAQELLLRY